ncbi:MAG: hypothetical protein R2795_09840 [Saprospiraceae bacterium]
MHDLSINSYMRVIALWDVPAKLKLLAKLREDIDAAVASTPEDPTELLERLYGAWADWDDSMVAEVLSARTTSDKDISFD